LAVMTRPKNIISRLNFDSAITCAGSSYREEGGEASLFQKKIIHKLFAIKNEENREYTSMNAATIQQGSENKHGRTG
jgi:hypothetical protein